MIVVEQPKRIKTFGLGFCALLPIYPPKINSFFLVWMVQNVKIGRQKLLVNKVKLNRLFCRRVDATRARHILILFFKISHAIAWVQIHCDGKSALFEPRKKRLVVRKQTLFKSVASPACPLHSLFWHILRHVFDDVPIHIYCGNRKRNVFSCKPIYKVGILLVSVGVIARPPVA